MWRLKVGEGGGPWLRSTNGFLGRTVWEFDAGAGSTEERAEVERVRREFADGRFRRRESGDILMRLQYAKQHKNHRRLPPLKKKKLEEKDEVTEEIALASLRRAMDQFSSLQSDDGCWPGDFSGVMFITEEIALASLRRAMDQFSSLQSDDGCWPGELRCNQTTAAGQAKSSSDCSEENWSMARLRDASAISSVTSSFSSSFFFFKGGRRR